VARTYGRPIVTPVSENLSPGYYPDPNDPSTQRWWNGQAWSGENGRPAESKDARLGKGLLARWFSIPPWRVATFAGIWLAVGFFFINTLSRLAPPGWGTAVVIIAILFPFILLIYGFIFHGLLRDFIVKQD